MNGRIATLMVHTSPLDQPGIGDAGGMNIYVTESAERMAAMGVQVDIFTRRTNKDVADIVEISPGVRVRQLNVGPVDGVTKERLPELIGELSKEFTRIVSEERQTFHSQVPKRKHQRVRESTLVALLLLPM